MTTAQNFTDFIFMDEMSVNYSDQSAIFINEAVINEAMRQT